MYSLAAYGQMVADHIRTDSYLKALKQLIKPGDVVVDIGTGPGILALLACRFGARRVYAFEPSGVIDLAVEIAAANGFADRIEFIPRMTSESFLPEPVNVIVSDIHGILPFFGKSLVSLIDARNRFLAPGGSMVPKSETLWIAGLSAPEIYAKHIGPWSGRPYDFDMSAAALRRINAIDQCAATAEQLFSNPAAWRRSTITRSTIRAWMRPFRGRLIGLLRATDSCCGSIRSWPKGLRGPTNPALPVLFTGRPSCPGLNPCKLVLATS